jgi:hypothetical protein
MRGPLAAGIFQCEQPFEVINRIAVRASLAALARRIRAGLGGGYEKFPQYEREAAKLGRSKRLLYAPLPDEPILTSLSGVLPR